MSNLLQKENIEALNAEIRRLKGVNSSLNELNDKQQLLIDKQEKFTEELIDTIRTKDKQVNGLLKLNANLEHQIDLLGG